MGLLSAARARGIDHLRCSGVRCSGTSGDGRSSGKADGCLCETCCAFQERPQLRPQPRSSVSRQLPWVFPVAGLRTLPAIVVVDGIGASVGGASAVASAANLRCDIGGSIARGVDRSSSSPRSSARSNPIVGAGASVSIYWQLDRQHQPAFPIFSSQRQLQSIPKRTTILWGCAAFCGSS